MFYNDEPKPINTISTLLTYYINNKSKIDELNVTNELLKHQVTSLMRQNRSISFLTCTSIQTYNKVNAYINKEIKRGHEDYKLAKDYYNYIVNELQKISTQITSIKKIMSRVGYSYTTIAIELVFDLNDNEFELHIPICENITTEDVFRNDFIDESANKFQLYARTSDCSITRIWVGEDISKINSEVDLTKNYTFK